MRSSPDPRSYLIQASLGTDRGLAQWSKRGYNADVGATEEDMWTPGGIYVWPTGNRMEVVSTSAQDSAAGTGIRSVQIGYLDTNYVEQSEIVVLNGVGAVGTVAVNILRVQSFAAYTVGGTIPSAAAGTINLRLFGGGAIYDQIVQGYTRGRDIFYCVPAGKVLVVTSIEFSTGSQAGARSVRFTSRATYDNSGTGRVLGANYFMPYTEVQVQDGAIYVPLEAPTRFPATVDIKISVISDTAGAVCACLLKGFTQIVGQV